MVEVSSPLYDALSENDKKIVSLFRQAGEIMDGLFWKQTFGDKALIEALPEGPAKEYALINYGAWDHLDDNKPFIEGYGEKPLGCCYYPQDMTMEEWNAFEDPHKLSLYTGCQSYGSYPKNNSTKGRKGRFTIESACVH